jgi:hypothetical protein
VSDESSRTALVVRLRDGELDARAVVVPHA